MISNRRLRVTLAAIALGLMPSVCLGDEINLSVELQKALFAKKEGISFPGLDSTYCLPNGRVMGNRFAMLFECVFSFKNVRGTPVSVMYSDIKRQAIPNRIVQQPFYYTNCTDDPLPVTDTISVTTTEGSSINNTTTVIEGSNASLSHQIMIPIKAIQLGITDTKTVSFSKSTSDTQSNNFQMSKTVTQQLNITVAPRTMRTTILEKTLTSGYIDFDGVVSFEADVYMTIKRSDNGQTVAAPVMLSTLTGYTPEIADRTLSLKGQIWNVEGEQVNRRDTVTKAADNPSVCP